jgi:uncharacterized membrane protein
MSPQSAAALFRRDLRRLFQWFRRRWLLLVNVATALTLIGALAAPVLAILGHASEAAAIHRLYLWLCPQRPEHSFFLMGQQLALEEREMAMFGVQLIAGLFFGARRDPEPLRWRLDWRWLLVASVPMAWDGLSQQFGLRVSDWPTRVWTGAVFSAAFVFWFYPFFDVALRRSPHHHAMDSRDGQIAELSKPLDRDDDAGQGHYDGADSRNRTRESSLYR